MGRELTKRCSCCGQVKPLSEFYHNSTKSDFHNGICAKCQTRVNKDNRVARQVLKNI